MKPTFSSQPRSLRRQSAYTLAEMLVAMGVFCLVILGVVYGHLYGLRQDQLVNSKLGATDGARRAFNRLTGEVRSAKLWRIGSGSADSFTPIPNGKLQQGSALQLNATTDTNIFVRYYFDTNHAELLRVDNVSQTPRVIVRYLTNNMYFRAEDYLGNPKTDLSYKYVIRVMMEFCQYQYPLTKVGPGYYYDYYKMEFRVTPHCPDGA